ncbi:MAG: pantoate--beta-alanine ligase [Bacteroidetes bacterium]|nr:pantoate--beta-alanine ligase [Bacteroidota bacterium]MCB9225707.1 pantoate--beta-alanine ligase [Chitinophagales bacterium]
MNSFYSIKALKKYLNQAKSEGKTIGFVPTMGALHKGHLSLVQAALNECNIAVASIFVNPTQFNNKEDLDKYPRTLEKDSELLENVGCHAVFAPTVKEMYPHGLKNGFEAPQIGNITSVLEGEHRPGHFEGMMQVVSLLLDIVAPTHLYMGLKDYQQFAIVSLMVEAQGREIIMRGMPIVREENGLAMSSRNERLSPTCRENAKIIYETLEKVKSQLDFHNIDELEKLGKALIEKLDGTEVEYFEIVDAKTLTKTDINAKKNLIALTAVWYEGIRLIDNMIL